MTHIDLIGDFTEAKYQSYIAYASSVDCDYSYDDTCRSIKEKYNIDFYMKQRINCSTKEYFENIVHGCYPWVYLDKSNNRNIFTILYKELYSDRVIYENFSLAIKNLAEMCRLHSVAYLAIPPMGINEIDNLDYNKVMYLLDYHFRDLQTEISIYWPDPNMLKPTPEEYYHPAALTEDVYEIPYKSGNDKDGIDRMYGHIYKYVPDKYYHPGPYPEYSIDESNTRVYTGRVYPDLNPKDKLEYLEIDQTKESFEFKDKINDPLKLHAIGLDGVTSHAYPLESILDPQTDYSKPPEYKYPSMINIPDPNDKSKIQPPARGNNNVDDKLYPATIEASLEEYPEFHIEDRYVNTNEEMEPTMNNSKYVSDEYFNNSINQSSNIIDINTPQNNDPLDRFTKSKDDYTLQNLFHIDQKYVETNNTYDIDGQNGEIYMPKDKAKN